MTWSAPAAFWFALSLAVIFVLHGIRLFRRRMPTTTLFIWRQIARESHTSLRLERVVRNLPLLLQLLLAALLVLALAQPLFFREVAFDKDLVLIVDTSASMKARAGRGTRFDEAREKALETIDGLQAEQRMALISMGAEPRLEQAFTTGKAALREAVQRLEPVDAPAALKPTLRFALSVAKDLDERQVALIGDGAYHDDPSAVALLNDTVSFLPVTSDGANAGIVHLAHRRYLPPVEGGELLIALRNDAEAPRTTTLEVTVGEQALARRELTLPPGGERLEIVAIPPAAQGLVRASLSGEDALPTDDVAYAVVGGPQTARVLLVGADAPALRAALGALPDTELTVRPQLNGAVRDGAIRDYDLALFNGVVPPPLRQGTLAVIGAASPLGGVAAEGWVERPRIVGWRPDEPLLRYLEPAQLELPRALRLAAQPGTETLLGGVDGPLIARRESGGLRVVTIGFDLTAPRLTQEDALPLLMANLVDWARPAPVAREAAPLQPGQPIEWRPRPGETGTLEVTGPDGRTWSYELDGNPVTFTHTAQAGPYTFRAGERTEVVPVNLLAPAESTVGPNPEVVGRPPESGGSRSMGEVAIEGWYWFALAGAAFLFLEWLVWNRFS